MPVATAPASPSVNSQFRSQLHALDRAIYLPAISATYAKMALSGLSRSYGGFQPTDLNFLDPANKQFHYPYALYSAGQHKTGAASLVPDIVSQRDRAQTIIVGDSGGYQVQTTPGYFTSTTTLDNMRWMESVADYSMVLDFPTGGIASGSMVPHIARLEKDGHDLDALNATNRLGIDYNACLLQTQINNDEFVKNRASGATQFLNVLQGRSEAESSYWYENVKHYPFEGWAFAGSHQKKLSLVLSRLLDMRRDGLLANAKWIHVLGTATLQIGVTLTAVQRAVREHDNPNLQISFDTSNPTLMSGAFNLIYAGATLDGKGWATQQLSPRDLTRNANIGDALAEHLEKEWKGRQRRVTRTAVSRQLDVSDLFKPGEDDLSPDGYNLIAHHNLEALLDAHDAAHELVFGERFVRDTLAVPLPLRMLEEMIYIILKSPEVEARKYIKEWKTHLDILS